jgi:hypothetical protein
VNQRDSFLAAILQEAEWQFERGIEDMALKLPEITEGTLVVYDDPKLGKREGVIAKTRMEKAEFLVEFADEHRPPSGWFSIKEKGIELLKAEKPVEKVADKPVK